MKQSSVCVCVLTMAWATACSSATSNPGTNAHGSAGSGGSGGAPVSGASGGPGQAGAISSAGAAGSAVGGAPGGNAGASGNPSIGGSGAMGGASGAAGAGGAAGATSTGFKCPPGPYASPALSNVTATRIPGAPPADGFNTNNYGNVEGPVWIGDSLYFSEMKNGSLPASRILKLAPSGAVTVAVADSGSNGLAVDASGNIVAAVHEDGSITQIALPSGTKTPLVPTYMGSRFISPNDLAIRSDGTIYFSDPNFQNNTNPPPQTAQRLYHVTPPPAREVSAIADAPNGPNGVTLSPDEHTLYVSSAGALKKFAVNTDGSLGAASDFLTGGAGDGMVVDCAGNLYVAGSNTLGSGIAVYSATGATLGTIIVNAGSNTTNVAFGGTDHMTLYITVMGNDGVRGVFSTKLNVPGYPY